MKKLIIMLCMFFICFSTVFSQIKSDKYPTAKINTNNLKLRSLPSTDSDILASQKKNSVVFLLARTKDKVKLKTLHDYWFYIQIESGLRGWTYGSFMDYEKKDIGKIPVRIPETAEVFALNVEDYAKAFLGFKKIEFSMWGDWVFNTMQMKVEEPLTLYSSPSLKAFKKEITPGTIYLMQLNLPSTDWAFITDKDQKNFGWTPVNNLWKYVEVRKSEKELLDSNPNFRRIGPYLLIDNEYGVIALKNNFADWSHAYELVNIIDEKLIVLKIQYFEGSYFALYNIKERRIENTFSGPLKLSPSKEYMYSFDTMYMHTPYQLALYTITKYGLTHSLTYSFENYESLMLGEYEPDLKWISDKEIEVSIILRDDDYNAAGKDVYTFKLIKKDWSVEITNSK